MFIHNIPAGFSIGILNIRYYGIIYALGFIVAYLFLRKEKEFLKLSEENLDKLFLYLIIGTILGARIFDFIFYRPDLLFSLEIFKIWNGGLSFHGGLIGIVTAIYLFSKKHKVEIYKITDTLTIPASLMLFFGRIANFINAELVGRVTNVPWAVNFNGEQNAAGQLVGRHPSQLYEALKNLFNFSILTLIKSKQKYKKGYMTWVFIFLYGVLRAFTNIWRDDLLHWGFLSTGQILSLIMALVAFFVLYNQYELIPTK